MLHCAFYSRPEFVEAGGFRRVNLPLWVALRTITHKLTTQKGGSSATTTEEERPAEAPQVMMPPSKKKKRSVVVKKRVAAKPKDDGAVCARAFFAENDGLVFESHHLLPCLAIGALSSKLEGV
jgi:hypothetical protein